jgi:diacylglycerol kinase family enzyme
MARREEVSQSGLQNTRPARQFEAARVSSFFPLSGGTIGLRLSRTSMKAIVLLNVAAGTSGARSADEDERAVLAAFSAAGLPVEVRRVDGPHLTLTAKEIAAERHEDQTMVVAAGGDGTQSAVAAALAGTSTPMGVLPMGTLNHFARDLGIPLQVGEAARVIATGRPRPIDVAQVNDQVFINNSSIGLYPQVVRHRDEQRERLGRGKWLAMLLAFARVFTRFPLLRLRMTVNGESWLRTTPFVFIGNNRYDLEGLNLGRRWTLEGGDLCVYFPERTGRLGLLRLTVRALLGHVRQDKDFNALSAAEIWIETPRKSLGLAIDGELRRFAPPLHIRIRPKSLNVMLPAADAR